MGIWGTPSMAKPKPGTLGGGILSQKIKLHGIKTNMLDHSSYNMHHGVSCPCGWTDNMCSWDDIGLREYQRILQFHYENCSKSKYGREKPLRLKKKKC